MLLGVFDTMEELAEAGGAAAESGEELEVRMDEAGGSHRARKEATKEARDRSPNIA